MNHEPTSPTRDKKRSHDEIDECDREVRRAVESLKRRRVELEVDGTLFESLDGDQVQPLRGNVFSTSLSPEDYETRGADEGPTIWEADGLTEYINMLNQNDDGAAFARMSPVSPEVVQVDDSPLDQPIQDGAGQGTTPPKKCQAKQPNPDLCPTRPIPPAAYGRRYPAKRSFPPPETPLPEGLTLAKHCECWPHHLRGGYLKRFIDEDWTAAKIFVSMHPDAREAMQKEAARIGKKGYEIMQERLDDITKWIAEDEQILAWEMAREDIGHAGQASATHGSSSKMDWTGTQIQAGQNSLGQSNCLPQMKTAEAFQHRSLPGHNPLHMQPNPAAERPSQHQTMSNSEAQNLIDNPVAAYTGTTDWEEDLVPDPASLPQAATTAPVTDHDGVHPAITEPKSDAAGCDLRAQIRDEIRKQSENIERTLQKHADWPRWTATQREWRAREIWDERAQTYEKFLIEKYAVDRAELDFSKNEKADVLDRQGVILWKVFFAQNPISEDASTDEFLAHCDRIMLAVYAKQLKIMKVWTSALGCNLTKQRKTVHGSVETADPVLNLPVEDRGRGPLSSTLAKPVPRTDKTWTTNATSKNSRQPTHVQPIGGNNLVWQQGSTVPLHTHVAGAPYMIASNIMNASMISPNAATRPAKLTTGNRTKARGKPRQRMFPTMPPSSQPLSDRARISDEEVLKKFPEHLSLPEVMRRFVRPHGSRAGGWETGRMVEILLKHPNSKDHARISDDERFSNVSAWVTKERDHCNTQIRKELGIAKISKVHPQTSKKAQDKASGREQDEGVDLL